MADIFPTKALNYFFVVWIAFVSMLGHRYAYVASTNGKDSTVVCVCNNVTVLWLSDGRRLFYSTYYSTRKELCIEKE